MDVNDITLFRIQNLRINCNLGSDAKNSYFDQVIGLIEDLLVDDNFSNIQKQFLDTYWNEFDDSEENKHSYMEIFKNYTDVIESCINEYLKQRIPSFKMEKFIDDLESRKNALEGEVFEILYTMTDFSAFKQMFLDYRKVQLNGEVDLSTAFCIRPLLPK